VAAPFPPLLAAVADDAGFLSLFTALVVVLLAGGAWLALRRRAPRAAPALLVVGVLLLAAAVLPTPATGSSTQVVGFLTGEARIPVRAEEGTPLRVDGGEGRVESDGTGQTLVLACAARCQFRLGADPAWGAEGAAALADAGDGLVVELAGGPLQVRSIQSLCQRLPLLVAWMGGGEPCLPCRTVEYLTGAGAGGTQRLTASPAPVC
jgi:hypothetical protein